MYIFICLCIQQYIIIMNRIVWIVNIIQIVIQIGYSGWSILQSDRLQVPPGYTAFSANANDIVLIKSQSNRIVDINMMLFKQNTNLYYAYLARTQSHSNPQILLYTIKQTSTYYIYTYVNNNNNSSDSGGVEQLSKYNMTVYINNTVIAQYSNLIAYTYMDTMALVQLSLDGSHGCNYIIQVNGMHTLLDYIAIMYSTDTTHPSHTPYPIHIPSNTSNTNTSVYLERRGTYYIGISHKYVHSLYSIPTVTLNIYQQSIPHMSYSPTHNTCVYNCSSFPHAYPSPSNLLSCNCIQYYIWVPHLLVCVPACGILPYSTTASLHNYQCQCNYGFVWDGTRCVINCTTLTYAKYAQLNTIDACECQDGYIWSTYSNLCVPNTGNNQKQMIRLVIILCSILIIPITITAILLYQINMLNNKLTNQTTNNKHKQEQSQITNIKKSTRITSSNQTSKNTKQKQNQIKNRQIPQKVPSKKFTQNYKNDISFSNKKADSSFATMNKSKKQQEQISYESED